MGDTICCGLGFLLTVVLGWKLALLILVVIELVLLVWIRDNLTLNVLMLVREIKPLKEWQLAHQKKLAAARQ